MVDFFKDMNENIGIYSFSVWLDSSVGYWVDFRSRVPVSYNISSTKTTFAN